MVRIRLARRGRKKKPLYDVVVADQKAPRDGRFIEKIGTYNPHTVPATIVLDEERALKWVLNGAQPTDTVRAMLSYRGVMFRKHLEIGVRKGAITEEQATQKFEEWKSTKDAKVTARMDKLSSDKEAAKKARLDAEAQVNAKRAEALKKKQEEAAKAAEAENADAEGEEGGDAEATAETNEAENAE